MEVPIEPIKADAISPITPITHSSGTLDWGNISSEIEKVTAGEVKAGPIRLFQGEHNITGRCFGKLHIEAEHSKEFAVCGFESFVENAVRNFDVIHKQGGKFIAVVRMGKSRLLAVLEYRSEAAESFYSIVTVFRPVPTKKLKGTIVWQKMIT